MRIAAITLLLGTLCLGACDDSNDVILIPLARTGTFVLQTVNGQTLPAILVDSVSPPLRIDVLSGAFSINSNNTFATVTDLRQTLGGVVTIRTVTCTGSFTVVGNAFTFVENVFAPDCGRTFTGVLNGTTLSTSIRGVPAVYFR